MHGQALELVERVLGFKIKRVLVGIKEVESSNDKPENLFLKPLHH